METTNLHIIIRHLIRKEAVRRAAEDHLVWIQPWPYNLTQSLECDICESTARMIDMSELKLSSVGWKYLRPGFGLCRKCSDSHNKPA